MQVRHPQYELSLLCIDTEVEELRTHYSVLRYWSHNL